MPSIPTTTNAHAGPSGTSKRTQPFQTPNPKSPTNVADPTHNDEDDDLSSLPDEYKSRDSDEESVGVVARASWKGKERMIIHSDSDDDDEEDVYEAKQEERYKRYVLIPSPPVRRSTHLRGSLATDNAKGKRQCTANNGTVNRTPRTNSTTRNYSAAERIGKASRRRRAIVGNAVRIVEGIDTSTIWKTTRVPRTTIPVPGRCLIRESSSPRIKATMFPCQRASIPRTSRISS